MVKEIPSTQVLVRIEMCAIFVFLQGCFRKGRAHLESRLGDACCVPALSPPPRAQSWPQLSTTLLQRESACDRRAMHYCGKRRSRGQARLYQDVPPSPDISSSGPALTGVGSVGALGAGTLFQLQTLMNSGLGTTPCKRPSRG